jgi:pimeloyl-ACP methyl ester carboxylesterase
MTSVDLVITEHWANSGDGWLLHLKQTVAPSRLAKGSRPVLIVPGYGMNAFIFGFHPRGTSMERWLAEAGLEVWSASLRNGGRSRAAASLPTVPSLRAFAETDIPVLIDAVLSATRTRASKVDLIGCSLGGSLLYAHMALVPGSPVGSLVSMGGPLRWTELHPLLKVAFSSPWLVGLVPLRGTRALAARALPLLARTPILSIYMNTANVDLTHAAQLVQTVDDPHPRVNRDIALWVRARDMVLRGVNVTDAMRKVDNPLLLVVSNRDGIVPESTAVYAAEVWGGTDVDVLRVGDDDVWYAHADLFVGDEAPEKVFTPIAEWLLSRA